MPIAFSLGKPAFIHSTNRLLIKIALPTATAIRISIIDMNGKTISRNDLGTVKAGYHQMQLPFSGSNRIGSGSYVLKVDAGTFRSHALLQITK